MFSVGLFPEQNKLPLTVLDPMSISSKLWSLLVIFTVPSTELRMKPSQKPS